MFDTVLYIVTQTITSPWVYAVLIALTALDGFLMFIPAETALAIVAALAAGGESSLLLTIAAGSTGAFLGDHTAYGIGRHGLGRFSNVMRAGSRARAASDWASRQLKERGGMALIASRFVPGVRTATTITMGAVGYPLRLFSLFDCVAATLWATGWSLVGYVGGSAFKNAPVKGVLLGVALAMTITLLAEAMRALRGRCR